MAMNWGHYLLVVVIASVVASFSDWLFMGVLFHSRYRTSPEIWRFAAGKSQRSLIFYSQIIATICCAAFAYLCIQGNGLTIPGSMRLAVCAWLAGPVVVLAQMVMWTKLDPLVGASQSLGWLARFVLTGLLAVWLL
jgi:hypothetical protein